MPGLGIGLSFAASSGWPWDERCVPARHWRRFGENSSRLAARSARHGRDREAANRTRPLHDGDVCGRPARLEAASGHPGLVGGRSFVGRMAGLGPSRLPSGFDHQFGPDRHDRPRHRLLGTCFGAPSIAPDRRRPGTLRSGQGNLRPGRAGERECTHLPCAILL